MHSRSAMWAIGSQEIARWRGASPSASLERGALLDDVSVRELDALRRACRPRGVDERREVVRGDRGRGLGEVEVRRGGGEQLLPGERVGVGALDEHDQLERGAAAVTDGERPLAGTRAR